MERNDGKTILKQDIVLGLVVAVFGAVALASTLSFPESSILYPRIVTSLIVVLGLLLTFKSAWDLKRGKYPEGCPVALARMKFPAIAYLIIVAYVVLIDVLGFYVSTVLFMTVFMRFMNIKSLKTILLTEAVLLIFVVLLFNFGLKVRFPAGLLI